MNFNFVSLTNDETTMINSFLVYANLKGYKTDYLCVFENNLEEKNDCIFIYKDDFNMLLLFSSDKKIKVHQEKKIMQNLCFEISNMKDMFNELYLKI